MLSHIDSTYLCQLTAAQIQEILVLSGVLIQQYQPHLHRWLTIAQLPDLGQLILSLEPEKAAEIDRRLHQIYCRQVAGGAWLCISAERRSGVRWAKR